VLVVPPEVNQSYIVDFAPGQSLVGAFVGAGFAQVAAMEWRSTDPFTRGRDIDDSLLSILDCIEVLGGRVHLVGVCQGGWESAIVAALRPDVTRSLTLVAAPIDCHAGTGIIKRLARTLPMTAYRAFVGFGGGEMKNELISLGFDSLLPYERFALKYLSLYNRLGDDAWLARYHHIDDWYRTPKNLPGPLYLRAVRELFKENRLFEGRFIALGTRVDLARITCPLVLVAGRRDHITPPEQVWAARKVTGSSDVLEVETGGGHVGTFMGRRELSGRWPTILSWLRERDAA
jgi:poly(3-hydroxyalkanoate) synthetase